MILYMRGKEVSTVMHISLMVSSLPSQGRPVDSGPALSIGSRLVSSQIFHLSTRLAAKSHDPQYQGDHPDQKAKVDEPVHHPQVKVLLWGCNNGKLKCICWLDFLHMCFGFHSSISQ